MLKTSAVFVVALVLSYVASVTAQDTTTLLTQFLSGLRSGYVTTPPVAFASLPACSTALKGSLGYVTDSNTATWGATVANGGSNNVGVSCNGTNWTVATK